MVKVMGKQPLLIALCGLMTLCAGAPAFGQNGFYGGVSMRENDCRRFLATLASLRRLSLAQ